MYLRSSFWYRGTSAKTTLLETTLLRTPEKKHVTCLAGMGLGNPMMGMGGLAASMANSERAFLSALQAHAVSTDKEGWCAELRGKLGKLVFSI